MNTEPPEGDDLQRMLVAMKQNVLERATPRRRRRARPGLVIGVVGLLALGTASGAVALSLSQQDRPVAAPTETQEPEPAPSATTPTSAPITATPTPRPVPTPTPTSEPDVRIPGDCYLLVPDSDYARFFGAAQHTSTIWTPEGGGRQPDGNDRIQGLRDPDEALSCTWQNEGVVANISVVVRPAFEDDAAEIPELVAESNPTCEDRLGGRACSWTPGTDSGDAVRGTYFTRGNLTIDIMQTDFPTNGLLPAIVGEIWGD
ncbi:hypothetical protein JOE58_002967 [Curtobacterium luteum]|uniref:Uncharacterized protein n=1 Tax=Curtobacterium luteum TaxID=33881 RepID=A0A8H9L0Z9_9MICO|nr:hypothetical protein [Curtobacterium luteum]MBM7803716.1 hypothetical protein [Curtobacterium luteum]NUU51559.1 hypothetical protein [Curtobacterium luteum]GGL03024.1 hypothetical protein GCM10009769_21490 [Curtobacterium luteum]